MKNKEIMEDVRRVLRKLELPKPKVSITESNTSVCIRIQARLTEAQIKKITSLLRFTSVGEAFYSIKTVSEGDESVVHLKRQGSYIPDCTNTVSEGIRIALSKLVGVPQGTQVWVPKEFPVKPVRIGRSFSLENSNLLLAELKRLNDLHFYGRLPTNVDTVSTPGHTLILFSLPV